MEGPLELRPSRRLMLVLALLHAAAIAAPWLADLPLSLRLAVSAAAAFGLAAMLHAWRRDLRSGGWRLQLHEGAWTLTEQGRAQAVEILGDSTVWEWLVVLRLRSGHGVRTLVLLPDSCSGEDLRRLRVALRMGWLRRAEEG